MRRLVMGSAQRGAHAGERLVYPVCYALDLDMFRTQLWLTGTYAVFMLSFAALFPETILPMFG